MSEGPWSQPSQRQPGRPLGLLERGAGLGSGLGRAWAAVTKRRSPELRMFVSCMVYDRDVTRCLKVLNLVAFARSSLVGEKDSFGVQDRENKGIGRKL